jgi:hypothetical protein
MHFFNTPDRPIWSKQRLSPPKKLVWWKVFLEKLTEFSDEKNDLYPTASNTDGGVGEIHVFLQCS